MTRTLHIHSLPLGGIIPRAVRSRPSARRQYFATDHLAENLTQRSARGGVIVLGSQAAKFLLMVSSQIVLARLLTPFDYGIVGMVVAVIGFIALFKDLGLSMATVQCRQITQEQASTLFWLNVAMSVATCLVTAAIAPLISNFYGVPQLTTLTIVLSTGYLLSGLAVQHQALLMRQMRFGSLAMIDIASICASVAVGIVSAIHGAGYWSLAAAELTRNLMLALLTWIACPWIPSRPADLHSVREMLAFGAPLTGFNVVNYFARNADNVLVGRAWGAAALGLYAKAYQMLMLPLQQISFPLASVAIPTLSRLLDSPARYRRAYLTIVERIACLSMPAMVFMIGSSETLIRVLLGEQWLESSRIFLWLAVAGMIQPLSSSTGWLFISQGRTAEQFRWSLIGTGLAVFSFLIGLPWGPVGVAASYALIWTVVCFPLQIWFVCRRGPVGVSDFYHAILPLIVASIISLTATIACHEVVASLKPVIALCILFVTTGLSFLLGLGVTRRGRGLLEELLDALQRLIGTADSFADREVQPCE
jgi:PST family polysaccharide transporter